MKKLLLLGAGHAHVHLLSTLANRPLAGVQITLVTPYPRQLYSGMVPGFVAGHYALDDCVIALEPLLKNTGIQWLQLSAIALDANAQTVTLSDGSVQSFDWLCINTGPVQDRQQIEKKMPGAQEHGLFLRPIESFGSLWPRVTTLADARPLRVVVVGGGAAGIELAMAVRHRLPSALVTLVTGGSTVAGNYPLAVQKRLAKALQRRSITVQEDLAVGLNSGEVLLHSGMRLACDVPIIAIGAQAPAWLGQSGMALDEAGFVAINACLQSTSHPHIFAAGDVSTRVDQVLPRSGVYAVRAGPALTKNLTAVVSAQTLKPHMPPKKTLNLVSCGDHFAIASWGAFSAEGRWVWWLKDRIDRSFIKRLRKD
jgi:pyridine nucleotide-disulfide oxidoreductase family protein